MYSISTHINEKGKGFFAFKMFDNMLGKLNVIISGNEMLLLDTSITAGLNKYSITDALQQGVVEYARMHELKIVTVAEFIKE